MSEPGRAYAGQLAEPGAPKHRRSCHAEIGMGEAITAGAPLIRGTDPDDQVKPIVAASVVNAQSFAGFALLDTSRPLNSTMIADGDDVTVLDEGIIILSPGEAVVAGEEVSMTLATGVLRGLAAGVVPASGVARLPGCRWEESGASGAMLKASVSRPPQGLEVESGTWAPTVTEVANTESNTAAGGKYMRIGNIVHCTIQLTADPSMDATLTQVALTLPIASDIGAVTDVTGVANRDTSVADAAGVVIGDATLNQAVVSWVSTGTSNEVLSCSFMYRVL